MFGKRYKLFTLMGFDVSIDLSWVLIALLVAWSLSTGFFPNQYKNLTRETYWFMGIVGALGLFASVVVHEFAHSLAARRFGLPMKGITLFIFGGVAEMDEEPKSPRAEFVMAIMGPVTSFFLAFLFYAAYRAGLASGWSAPLSGVLGYLAAINMILAVFNMVPAFPLDGGRVLRAILWKVKGDLKAATRISASIGQGFAVVLILLGVVEILYGSFVSGMWWVLIGLFLNGVAKSSFQQLVIRNNLAGEPVSRFMKAGPVTVPPETDLATLVEEYVYRLHFKMYPVTRDGRLLGCVTTREVKEVPREEWAGTKVGDILTPCDATNTVSPDADAVEALSLMSRSGLSRLMVREGDRLAGVITLKDMLDFLSLKVELDS